jgi:hypothetical protein
MHCVVGEDRQYCAPSPQQEESANKARMLSSSACRQFQRASQEVGSQQLTWCTSNVSEYNSLARTLPQNVVGPVGASQSWLSTASSGI